MDFSLHEQRTLAKIEHELSDDHRLAALMTILGSKKSTRARLWRAFWCRVRHPRQESLVTPGNHHPMDTRPLLAVTIVLAVVCAAVLITALVLGTTALVVSAAVVLPLPPALALVAYLRLRRANRRMR